MELMEAIRGRRSIRSYKKRPVEDEKLKRILEAAHSAPSAAEPFGLQPMIIECHGCKFSAD